MGDLREFSTNQSFNEYILRSMSIRKSMKNMKRIWHLRWIIHIHLLERQNWNVFFVVDVNYLRDAEEKEQPPTVGRQDWFFQNLAMAEEPQAKLGKN